MEIAKATFTTQGDIMGARTTQPLVCSRFAAPNRRSLDDKGRLASTGRDTLWKLGEVAITASWISANSSLVPLPLMRTV